MDPLKVNKDTFRVVMENPFVRVSEERVPPGTTQIKHRHAHGVTVSLSDFDSALITYPDQKEIHRHTSFGEVRWTEAVVHQTTNVGKTEQRVVRVELKY